MQDEVNARFVDPLFASGKAYPTLDITSHRSLAQPGSEDHPGRKDALDLDSLMPSPT